MPEAKKPRMPIMMEKSNHCVGIIYAPSNCNYGIISELLKELAENIDKELSKQLAKEILNESRS